MSPRPYGQHSIDELEKLVDQQAEILEELRAELRRRRSRRARRLLRQLEPERIEDHSVYVVELDTAVWDAADFASRNEEEGVERGSACLYVGKTVRTPEVRFRQHKDGVHPARKVRKYGVRLRPEFYERLNPMTREEAEEEERRLAATLQRAGYAVWWN